MLMSAKQWWHQQNKVDVSKTKLMSAKQYQQQQNNTNGSKTNADGNKNNIAHNGNKTMAASVPSTMAMACWQQR